MDKTERGVVVIDIFGEDDNTGFGVISSDSPLPEERPEVKGVPMPELQIVPASPIVKPTLPAMPVMPALPVPKKTIH